MDELPSVSQPLDLRVERQGQVALIAFFGELEGAAEERLQRALTELGPEPLTRVVIDLSGLTFADSNGVFLFVALWDRLRGLGADVVFEGAREQVQRLFRVTGLDRVLPVAEAGAPAAQDPPASRREHEWATPAHQLHPTGVGMLRPISLGRRGR